ncbi:PilZ domain-containing protein [Ferrimonas aestuarii]|uniref:Cyclic diguanosine monophosphate-binding protein n=1 Tax=Ferrimonas aestuarii TaxID=2569539 RepID=A0A4U1BT03_9GAMM|nr:PilZ domain-containing protein [Ferrimonas aestuarii]TKB55405.1 PilZ domain-containing protein [Ferrimonas aestuarii]
MDERRHFTRVQFIAPAQIDIDNKRISSRVWDISLHGILLAMPEEFTPTMGQSLKLTIPLSDDVDIQMQAEVQRINAISLGLVWHNIDVESLIHLRRLVELHSPHSLNKELEELWQEM